MTKESKNLKKQPPETVKPLGVNVYRPSGKNRTEIPVVTQELGDPWSNNSVIDWCVTYALPTLRERARKMKSI